MLVCLVLVLLLSVRMSAPTQKECDEVLHGLTDNQLLSLIFEARAADDNAMRRILQREWLTRPGH